MLFGMVEASQADLETLSIYCTIDNEFLGMSQNRRIVHGDMVEGV